MGHPAFEVGSTLLSQPLGLSQPVSRHLGGVSPMVYLSALPCLFCSQDQRALGRVWGQESREAVTQHRWGVEPECCERSLGVAGQEDGH